LVELENDDTLVLSEVPDTPEQPRRGWLRRSRPTPVRYVQFRRSGDLITGECVGPLARGGYYEIDDAQDQRLRELGWKAPDQLPNALRDSPNYRVDAPREESSALAELAVGAFAVLGLPADAELDWRRL
jgi:hypothetical protein